MCLASSVGCQRDTVHHVCCWAPCCGAVAVERWRLLSIDLLPAGRSAANPPAAVAAVDRWDRQTDGQTNAWLFHRSRSMHRLCTCGHWAVSINTHSVLQKPNTMTRVSLDIILQQISVDQQIMFFGCPSSSDCRSKRLRVISLCRTLVLLPHCILNSAVRCYGCPCTY